jgi:uncharacterized protein YqeY
MLEDKLKEDLKNALKSGDQVAVSTVRLIINSVKNRRIDEQLQVLPDDKVISAIQKLIKQHRESIDQFAQGGRTDLVEKEEAELRVLNAYMPLALNEADLDTIIDNVVKDTGALSVKDMGKVMKEVNLRVAGRADGRLVSDKVKLKLTK